MHAEYTSMTTDPSASWWVLLVPPFAHTGNNLTIYVTRASARWKFESKTSCIEIHALPTWNREKWIWRFKHQKEIKYISVI